MISALRPALTMLVAMTLLTGVAYPLAMTGIARVIAPEASRASILERDGQPIGSALVGQAFAAASYLHPRPSAVDYATMPSGASNLGPTSPDLLAAVATRRAKYEEQNGVAAPVDALTASASGLDPDISPENAHAQASRIAASRGVDVEAVRAVIEANSQGRWLGLFGEPRVNVLGVNLALDLAAPLPPAGGN
jgi:K+-transporting ATPase ATPase C chain